MSGFVANSAFSCYAQSANTGKPKCDINFGPWTGHFLAPLNDGLTQAEVDAFTTTAQARCIDDTYAERWHKVGRYENIEDKSDEPTESELGNFKRKVYTDEGTNGYEVGILTGGFEHLLDLRTFNNKTSTYGIVQFDGEGNVAMRYDSATGKYYPLKMDTYFWRRPKNAAPGAPLLYMGMIRLTQGDQLDIDMRAIQTGVDLVEEITGVNDVILEDVSDSLAAGIFDIIPRDHSVNMASTLGSILNSTTVWLVKRKESGNAITVSSVASTVVSGQAACKLTLSTADPDYAAGEVAVVYWAVVSVVAGVSDSLKYYETVSRNPAFTSGQFEVTLT